MATSEGYKIKINNKDYTNDSPFITGAKVKILDNVPANHAVFLKVSGPGQDQKIEDNEQVNLAKPGTEHFFTTPTTTTEG